MTVQEAIQACKDSEESFARPVHWKGRGQAVDLAKKVRPDRLSRVIAVRASIAYCSDWNVTPEDLLGEWEVVSLKQISDELGPAGNS